MMQTRDEESQTHQVGGTLAVNAELQKVRPLSREQDRLSVR